MGITAPPRLVRAYLEREGDTFESVSALYHFIVAKIEQVGPSAAVLVYMMGCTYAEARSMLRWVQAQGP